MARKAEALAPAQEAQEPTTAETLAALKAEAAPLTERLRGVESALADLDRPAGPQPVALEHAVKARQQAAVRRVELEAERDVLTERLDPLHAEITRLEAEAEAERIAAERSAAIEAGLAALTGVVKAREVLDAEVTALVGSGALAQQGWLPEVHFAVKREIEAVAGILRRLDR